MRCQYLIALETVLRFNVHGRKEETAASFISLGAHFLNGGTRDERKLAPMMMNSID